MKKLSLTFSLCFLAIAFSIFVISSRLGEAKTSNWANYNYAQADNDPWLKYSISTKTLPQLGEKLLAPNTPPSKIFEPLLASYAPPPLIMPAVSRPSNFYLSFPLPNRTAYTALINSVFDHYAPNGWYCPDNKVIAFTGETGELNPSNPNNKVFGNIISCGNLYAFQNKTVAYPFIINGNYAGVGQPTYLFYDSHDGIDFKTTDQGNGGVISVLATADGQLTCGSSAYGTIDIDHGNGFKTRYLHLSTRYCGLGRVVRGQEIGLAGGVGANGSVHLHFSVFFNDGVHGDQLVDPYGWQGQYQDPRLDTTGVANTNLWKPQAFTATTLTDNHIRWHPDGSLLSSITDSNHTVWLIQGGKKRGIPSIDVFRAYGFDFANVINVSPEELACYSDGGVLGMPPTPRLINDHGTIYEITDQHRKRAFSSVAAFQGQGFRWEDVQTGSVSGINDDPNLPVYSSPFRDGALVALLDTSVTSQRRIAPNTPVYIISNSKKRPFVSGNTFLLMGYRFDDVMTVTQDVLNSIPDGFAIDELDPLRCSGTLLGSGETDFFPPSLTISTPNDGQTFNINAISISGTASDLNSGNSGIASVKVNGVRANGDTASGTGTANWSISISLSQGANTITIVATDGSINQNSTTKTITVNYQPNISPTPTPTPIFTPTPTSTPQLSWFSLGGWIDELAVASDADGRLEVFVRGSNGALYHRAQLSPGSDSWSAWAPLGGWIDNLFVARNQDGRLEVFVRGSDGALYHKAQVAPNSDVWGNWASLGGWFDQLSVGNNSDGRLEVFVRGIDGALYHRSQIAPNSNEWGGWASLGGWFDELAVGRNADGRLEVFVRGGDQALYYRSQVSAGSNTWKDWASLGGWIDRLEVGGNLDGRLEVFVRGSDGALYHRTQLTANLDTWGQWSSLGGWFDQLNVASNTDGRLEVFVRGADGALYHNWQTSANSNSWSGWAALGGWFDELAIGHNSNGYLEAFVRGKDQALYYRLVANTPTRGGL